MQRRDFLRHTTTLAGIGLAANLTACARRAAAPTPGLAYFDQVPPLVPIRATADRIFRITVCLRPFRAAGPRLDVERLGDKIIAHNYGHGGSGWSLSWGSSTIALENALAASGGDRNIAVLGCGALGLTSALLAQRAGARVTIYAKERPPEVRSSRATGTWTPDSRIALASKVAPTFAAQWERMARTSWSTYQSYLGLPGDPVEYIDRYVLKDTTGPTRHPHPPDPMDMARFSDRIADISAGYTDLPAGTHPFPTPYVSRSPTLVFNVADYAHQLVTDFLIAGGKIETMEFHSPQDLAALPQKTIINCTGYGARQLWSDESITPVRGQIAWLIPQQDLHYALWYKGVNVIGRRDGIVVQNIGRGDMEGYNDSSETPDRAAAEADIQTLAELYQRMSAMPHRRT